MINEESIQKFRSICDNIFTQIRRDVIGQDEVVEGTVIAMIAGGNVLLDGELVHVTVEAEGEKLTYEWWYALAGSTKFYKSSITTATYTTRMDATRDGRQLYCIVKDENGNSSFQFQPGPVFSNIVLADEINRATPKTQSALLEAMQEHTVTVMGVSRKMKEPFFVLATQNPIEQDGTYPLPEAQMDRFMFNLIVPNPGLDELMQIVDMTQKTMAEVADAACSGEQLLEMRATASQIPVANEVMRYAMTLCSATHADSECASEAAKKYVRLGASPRAGQALISAAKVRALMQGRYNVAYSDVNALALPVLRHRMKLNFEAIADRVPADDIVRMIVAEVSKRFDVDGTVASVDTKESTAEGKKKRGFGKKTS